MGIKQTSLGGAPKTRIPSTPYGPRTCFNHMKWPRNVSHMDSCGPYHWGCKFWMRNHCGWDPPPSNIHLLSYIYITRVYIYNLHTHTHTHIYIYTHNGHVAKSDIDASNELIGNFGDMFYVHPPILQSMITQIDRFCGCKKGWIWMDGWMDKLVDRFV